MKQKTWGTLDCRDLVMLFEKMFHANVQMGRDAALLKRLMDDNGLSPIQILYGFIIYKNLQIDNSYIYAFCQTPGYWSNSDPLEAAAELYAHVTGEALPPFYWGYLDLRDGGDTGDARTTEIYQQNKTRLEQWLDEWLRKPLSPGDRAIFAQRATQRRGSVQNTDSFRFTGE